MAAAASGSGRPFHAGSQVAGLVNVTRLPWLMPLQSRPCHAGGLRTAPQPEPSFSTRFSSPVRATISPASSSW